MNLNSPVLYSDELYEKFSKKLEKTFIGHMGEIWEFFKGEEPKITINTDEEFCVIEISPLSLVESYNVDTVREKIKEIFKIFILERNEHHPIAFIVSKYDKNLSDVKIFFTFWHWLSVPEEDNQCSRCHNKKEQEENDFCYQCIDVFEQLRLINLG